MTVNENTNYRPKFTVARIFGLLLAFSIFFAMWHYWGSTVAVVGFYLLIPYGLAIAWRWAK